MNLKNMIRLGVPVVAAGLLACSSPGELPSPTSVPTSTPPYEGTLYPYSTEGGKSSGLVIQIDLGQRVTLDRRCPAILMPDDLEVLEGIANGTLYYLVGYGYTGKGPLPEGTLLDVKYGAGSDSGSGVTNTEEPWGGLKSGVVSNEFPNGFKGPEYQTGILQIASRLEQACSGNR